MTATTTPLEQLIATGANEHAFSLRVHELPLRELYLELRAVLDRLSTELGWGDEGLSAVYRWDADMHGKTGHAIAARGFNALTETTKLSDVRYRWICVFPVTGGNEGHYIHVDLIWQREYQEGRVPLFMMKTFGGHAEAIEIAGVLCRLLGV